MVIFFFEAKSSLPASCFEYFAIGICIYWLVTVSLMITYKSYSCIYLHYQQRWGKFSMKGPQSQVIDFKRPNIGLPPVPTYEIPWNLPDFLGKWRHLHSWMMNVDVKVQFIVRKICMSQVYWLIKSHVDKIVFLLSFCWKMGSGGLPPEKFVEVTPRMSETLHLQYSMYLFHHCSSCWESAVDPSNWFHRNLKI